MKGFLEMKKRASQDNRGIALVSVLIIITLCFLLSGAIMQVSYMALLSRNVSTASANNFYDAEAVVDDMKIELQAVAAAALQVSGSQNTAAYVDKVYTMLTTRRADSTITSAEINDILADNLAYYSSDIPGAVVSIDPTRGGIEKSADNTSVLIKGVIVEYTDPNTGYYSQITTDIRVNAPYYASSESHAVGTYSMFAGSGAELVARGENPNEWGNLTQEGNVYIGYMSGTYDADQKKAKALDVHYCMNFTCSGDNIVINGDVYVEDRSNLIFTGNNVEVRGTIYLNDNSHLIVADTTNLVVGDIVVDGKSVVEGVYQLAAGKEFSSGLPYAYYTASNSEYINQSASVIYYSGGKCYEALCGSGVLRKQTGELLEAVYFDNSDKIKPTENIEVEGVKYDAKYSSIIDIEYFRQLSYSTVGNYKNPRKRLNDDSFDEINNKYIIKSLGVVDDQNSYRTYQYAEGMSVNVEVNIGTLSEVANPGVYFIIKYGDLSVPMNSNNTYTGLFMATGKVTFTHGGNETFGVSLINLDTTSDMKYLKAYLGNLAKCMMDSTNTKYPNGTAYDMDSYKYVVINNIFNGGIKIFYEAGGTTSGGTGDTSQNENLNLIELENWNKN